MSWSLSMHANQLPLLSLVRSFMNFVASVQNFIFTANVVINWTEMDNGYNSREREMPVTLVGGLFQSSYLSAV